MLKMTNLIGSSFSGSQYSGILGVSEQTADHAEHRFRMIASSKKRAIAIGPEPGEVHLFPIVGTGFAEVSGIGLVHN